MPRITMNTDVHNQPDFSVARAVAGPLTIATLGDLITFVDGSGEIPALRKPHLRSALNRARALLGNGLADVRADPRDVLRQLDRLSPAMAGMAPQSYANLKSRVRSVFRLAAPH